MPGANLINCPRNYAVPEITRKDCRIRPEPWPPWSWIWIIDWCPGRESLFCSHLREGEGERLLVGVMVRKEG